MKRISVFLILVSFAVLTVPLKAEPVHLYLHRDGAPRRYVAVFSSPAIGGRREAEALAHRYHAKLLHVYEHALAGFSVEMSEQDARRMSRDARITSIEQDVYVRPTSVQTGAAVNWALDRIDQSTGLNGSYTYMKTGAGVRVYILDSGVDTDDAIVTNAYTAATIPGTSTPDYSDVYCAMAGGNCHGSKVASIIGGSLYGVAKGASLFNVRVVRFAYDIYGNPTSDITSSSDVLGGIDWAVGNHQTYPSQPAVMNISLSWANGSFCSSCQQSLEQAVINAIDAGIVVVAGAGNYTTTGQPSSSEISDACSSSPSRLGALGYAAGLSNPHNRTTITVSATNDSDSRARNEIYYDDQGIAHYWSANGGPCVDIFSPGLGVGARGGSTPDTFSGTSAAAPFVTGVVALYLEGKGSSYDPNNVETALKSNATSNVLTNIGTGSPNLFLYSRVDLWH